MENLSAANRGRLTANQILNDFISFSNDAASIKNDMNRIFLGFYIADEVSDIDRNYRSDIAFSFSRVMDLLTNIEKYKSEDTEHEDFNNEIPEYETKKSPAGVEAAGFIH